MNSRCCWTPWSSSTDVAARLLAEVDGYHLWQSSDLSTQFFDQCRRHLRLLIRMARTGHAPRSAELDFVRQVAIRRADELSPLHSLLPVTSRTFSSSSLLSDYSRRTSQTIRARVLKRWTSDDGDHHVVDTYLSHAESLPTPRACRPAALTPFVVRRDVLANHVQKVVSAHRTQELETARWSNCTVRTVREDSHTAS